MENAKVLAELVDNKLARHYELDDNGKKKVRLLQNRACWHPKPNVGLGELMGSLQSLTLHEVLLKPEETSLFLKLEMPPGIEKGEHYF